MRTSLALVIGLFAGSGASAFDEPVAGPALRGGYDWSGAYIGAHAGHGWGGASNNWHGGGFPPWQTDGDINYQSLSGGVHAGYQMQTGGLVAGVETDISQARYFGDDSQFAGVVNQIEIGAVGSLRGRLGWAHDNIMIYGTAGVAAGSFLKSELGGAPMTPQLAIGWTAGGGVELAVSEQVWVRAEYLHTRFGNVETNLGYMHRANAPTLNVLRVGASYRF